MPKRKEPELDPKEQFKRFVDAAREHEVDETGTTLDREFNKLSSTAKKRSVRNRKPRADRQ